jgi:hypothetical protein
MVAYVSHDTVPSVRMVLFVSERTHVFSWWALRDTQNTVIFLLRTFCITTFFLFNFQLPLKNLEATFILTTLIKHLIFKLKNKISFIFMFLARVFQHQVEGKR